MSDQSDNNQKPCLNVAAYKHDNISENRTHYIRSLGSRSYFQKNSSGRLEVFCEILSCIKDILPFLSDLFS